MTMREYDAASCHWMVLQCLSHLQNIKDSEEHHEPWITKTALSNVIGEMMQWRNRLDDAVRIFPEGEPKMMKNLADHLAEDIFDPEDACYKLLNQLGLRGTTDMLAKVLRDCAKDGLSIFLTADPEDRDEPIDGHDLKLAANNLEADLF